MKPNSNIKSGGEKFKEFLKKIINRIFLRSPKTPKFNNSFAMTIQEMDKEGNILFF